MFGKVKRLEKITRELTSENRSLTLENNGNRRRVDAAIKILCVNCPLYRTQGNSVSIIKCDYYNCPIYRKVILLSEDEE